MKPHLFVLVAFMGVISGCSSSGVDSPSTTISPLEEEVENLQKQVDELKSQLDATTIPTTTMPATTTTQKPAAKIVDVRRFFSGYTKGFGSSTQHECREIFIYSDGTEFESPRRWVSTGQDSFGNYNRRDC